jgi:hypothetical protein
MVMIMGKREVGKQSRINKMQAKRIRTTPVLDSCAAALLNKLLATAK